MFLLGSLMALNTAVDWETAWKHARAGETVAISVEVINRGGGGDPFAVRIINNCGLPHRLMTGAFYPSTVKKAKFVFDASPYLRTMASPPWRFKQVFANYGNDEKKWPVRIVSVEYRKP